MDIETKVKEELGKSVDGQAFLSKQHSNGKTNEAIKEIKQIVSKYHFSALEAIGLMEYMKLAIKASSYIPEK